VLVTGTPTYPPGTEWLSELGLGPPHRGLFGNLRVWVADTTFPGWPAVEVPDLSTNCQKGPNLVNHRGMMSCAEVEIVRRFRANGWKAGWLATCGKRNAAWRRYMCTPSPPKRSILDVPIQVLPSELATLVLKGGASGWPDVVAWEEVGARVVFVEAKGPGDRGSNQAPWITRMRQVRRLGFNQFVRVDWTHR
jgi:hypothetical protein